MPYRPALDGLRGLAVAAVLAFHSSAARYVGPDALAFPGGWLGVDIFFVLSGYLITRILLAEQGATHTISLRRFYARRARRLLPALAVTLAATAVYVAATGSNAGGVAYPLAALGALSYVANWFISAGGGGLGLLNHTWSLAIEEQFYAAGPALLRRTLRRGVTWRALARWLATLTIVCAVYRGLAFLLVPDRAIFHTPARADGLLLGALVAVGLHRLELPHLRRLVSSPVAVAIAGTCAFALMLVLRPFGDEAWPTYAGGLLVFNLTVAVVVAHAGETEDGASPIARVLSWRPIVELGRISYGVYLFHIVVYEAIHRTPVAEWRVPAETVVQIGASILLAKLSYEVVERRFLARSNRAGAAQAQAQPSLHR